MLQMTFLLPPFVRVQFMNVNSSYTYIVQGLVIIVAVAIDIRKYLAKK